MEGSPIVCPLFTELITLHFTKLLPISQYQIQNLQTFAYQLQNSKKNETEQILVNVCLRWMIYKTWGGCYKILVLFQINTCWILCVCIKQNGFWK